MTKGERRIIQDRVEALILALLVIVLMFGWTIVIAEERGEGWFLGGELGVGAYARDLGDPEITTPNGLGNISFEMGYMWRNDVSLRFHAEHWSSLQGFPDVFNSPEEDGQGFNAVWLKVGKRFWAGKGYTGGR